MDLFPLETTFPAMGFPKLCPISSGSISSTPSTMDFKPTLAMRLGTLEGDSRQHSLWEVHGSFCLLERSCPFQNLLLEGGWYGFY